MLERGNFESPIGPIALFAYDDRLVGLEFADRAERIEALQAKLEQRLDTPAMRDVVDPAGAATRLRAYFDGDRDALAGQPVTLYGTPFQRAVWAALCEIPAGVTWSYAQLAERVGCPGGQRAAGAANGRNPVSLVVPCHRVIASSGALHGYGGGLERKAWLLEHEGARVARRTLPGIVSETVTV